MLMLEALQYEEEQDHMCVHIEELEEILEHYGVSKQAQTKSFEAAFSNGSEKFEYSDESPVKISPTLSDHSPFASGRPHREDLEEASVVVKESSEDASDYVSEFDESDQSNRSI